MTTTTTANRSLTLGKVTVTSAAQLMTLCAYGDSSMGDKAGMPFRNLNFRAECESFDDFAKCIDLIESYNEFDADQMRIVLKQYLNLKKYYKEGNPNNGNDFFKFEIAREGSPAFYVSFMPNWDKQVYRNGEPTPYTLEQFKTDMEALCAYTKADEMDIEEGQRVEARFWFD